MPTPHSITLVPLVLALAGLALLVPLAGAPAAERPVTLQPGAGRELVQSSCASCHSLDYVLINAPFLSPAQWQASVAKMRTVFGAPIGDDEAAVIVAYLASAYGPPPAPAPRQP